jgi:hypothetical protein
MTTTDEQALLPVERIADTILVNGVRASLLQNKREPTNKEALTPFILTPFI